MGDGLDQAFNLFYNTIIMGNCHHKINSLHSNKGENIKCYDEDDIKKTIENDETEEKIDILKILSNKKILNDDLEEDINKNYNTGPYLGHGAFGIVTLCTNKVTKNEYACKTINLKSIYENYIAYKGMRRLNNERTTDVVYNDMRRLKNEITTLLYLNGHPNIINLQNVYESRNHIYIIQEYCSGLHLKDSIKYDEDTIGKIFRGIIKAVLHCHQMGILHRDIKLCNFLLSNKTTDAIVKLADFGLACFFNYGILEYEMVGSAYYMAPELINKVGYGPEADIWSCGICLYKLASGEYPFEGETAYQVFKKLNFYTTNNMNMFPNRLWKNASPDILNLLKGILVYEPDGRLKVHEILNHEWMLKYKKRKIIEQTSTVNSASMSITLDTNEVPKNELISSTRSFFPSNIHKNEGEFIVNYKHNIEKPFYKLIKAKNPNDAYNVWQIILSGLITQEKLFTSNGQYYLGDCHGLVEAVITPSLCRINSSLIIIRELDIIQACCDLSLNKLTKWIRLITNNPEKYSDVDINKLPFHNYIALLRKLYITYEGPVVQEIKSIPKIQSTSSMQGSSMYLYKHSYKWEN